MDYQDLEPITREEFRARFDGASDHDAGEAMLRLAWHEADSKWAERECVTALDDRRLGVRLAAATALGHLARRQKGLNPMTVSRLIALKHDRDIGGCVHDALDDLVVFGRNSSEIVNLAGSELARRIPSVSDHRPTGPELGKVTFTLERRDWHDHATETMWARRVGKGRWQLQNIPFYVYGYSCNDVVDTDESGAQNFVKSKVERGGHSTYRIFVTNDESLLRFDEFWRALERCGCTLERATQRLFAIDVPADTNIYDVYDALEAGQRASAWDFEEAHLGHSLRTS